MTHIRLCLPVCTQVLQGRLQFQQSGRCYGYFRLIPRDMLSATIPHQMSVLHLYTYRQQKQLVGVSWSKPT